MDKFADEVKQVLMSTPHLQRLKKKFINKWKLFTYVVECENFHIDDHFEIISEPMKE